MLLLVGLLFSCTKDAPKVESIEDPIEDPKDEEEIVIEVKAVLESIQKTYNKDSGNLEAIYKNKFENNRLKKSELYNADEELTYYNNWEYNADGTLSKLTGYKPDDILDYESTLTHDDAKRLVREETSEEKGIYIKIVDITYNSDNTITRTQSLDGNAQTKLYFLNENNIIYKVEKDGETIEEAVYDENNNVLSMNDESVTYSYFDMTIVKKGAATFNLIGGDTNNVVLWGEHLNDQAEIYSMNYVKKITYSSNDTTYEREFDDDDDLLKMTLYSSGQLYSVTELIYQE